MPTYVPIGDEEQLFVGVVFESWQERLFPVVLLVDLVRLECFPNATVVRDVLSESLQSVNLQANAKFSLVDKQRLQLNLRSRRLPECSNRCTAERSTPSGSRTPESSRLSTTVSGCLPCRTDDLFR